MSQPRLRRRPGQPGTAFPRKLLLGAALVAGFAIVATVFGQTTGIGTVKVNMGEPSAIRDIHLARGDDGLVRVSDAATGAEIAAYAEGEGGFVSGSVRGLDRMRQTSQAAMTAPYRLIRWTNGAVSLSDTATGERIYLNAFGPDNAAAFARLLDTSTGEKE